jgi:hypothetical protein
METQPRLDYGTIVYGICRAMGGLDHLVRSSQLASQGDNRENPLALQEHGRKVPQPCHAERSEASLCPWSRPFAVFPLSATNVIKVTSGGSSSDNQAHPPCKSSPTPTPASVPTVTIARNSRPARMAL